MIHYTIATSKYFETLAHFPFIADRLFTVGSLWIELSLTQDEKDSINLMFPNRIYL